MVQPAELSDGERKRFLAERLRALHDARVRRQRSVVGALSELVRRIKDAADPSPRASPPSSARRRRDRAAARRHRTIRSCSCHAKGTRDNLGRPPSSKRRAHRCSTTPRAAAEPRRRPRRRSVRRRVDPSYARACPSCRRRATSRTSVASATVAMPERIARRARARRIAESTPSRTRRRPTPGMIYARYLRSGRWVPMRVGALSLKGAALLTGALPRSARSRRRRAGVRRPSRARARRGRQGVDDARGAADRRGDVLASRSSSTSRRAASSPRCSPRRAPRR